MKPILILLLILIVLSSCEGFRMCAGIVKDAQSKQPMDSVYVEVLTGNETMYTDTTGKFNVQNRMGGCMPCADIVVKFSKAGYKSIELKNADSTEVLLEKQ